VLKSEKIDQISNALNERDEFREKLLSTDQIYSVIVDYIDSEKEQDVRKALDDLTSQ